MFALPTGGLTPDNLPAASALVIFAIAAYLFYMFAAFVAEAHGFERVWLVLFAVIWIGFALMTVMVIVLGRAPG